MIQSGAMLETVVVSALRHGGYAVEEQVAIGMRPGNHGHVIDAIATSADGRRFLVSVKWQQVRGTAEQKVPWEVICLIRAVRHYNAIKAYLVLGGEGWSLRSFFIAGLRDYLPYEPAVEIVTIETFLARSVRQDL